MRRTDTLLILLGLNASMPCSDHPQRASLHRTTKQLAPAACMTGTECAILGGQENAQTVMIQKVTYRPACRNGGNQQLVLELWIQGISDQVTSSQDVAQPRPSPLLYLSRGLSPTVRSTSTPLLVYPQCCAVVCSCAGRQTDPKPGSECGANSSCDA